MNTHVQAMQVRHRRALGLMLMSAVLPGSAQFVAGNRKVGRWALRTVAAIVCLALLCALGLVVARGLVVQLVLTPWVVATGRVLLWALFVGWAILLLDAWRLTRPPSLHRKARLILTASSVVLIVSMAMATSVTARAFTAVEKVGSVFSGGGEKQQRKGRYNILLLGVDSAASRVGIRPDSLNVASIDAETGRTVLFGLPRNLQGVQFPKSSPLHALYPDGFRCKNAECMLNAVYKLGEEHKDKFPGVAHPGLEATKQAVSQTLGLDLNYYVMVDMAGFSSLIDAMGGIRLNAYKKVPIGGGSTKIHGYVGPGENLHLNGSDALWFARSRAESSDYERMVRQKCVMKAMAKQLDPATVAAKFSELAEAGAGVVSTDVGGDHVAELVELAIRGKNLPIDAVNFVPPLINTVHPDFELIRSTVASHIAESEQLDARAKNAGDNPAASPSPAKPAHPASAASTNPDAPLTSETAGAASDAPTGKPAQHGEGTSGESQDGGSEKVGEAYGGNPELSRVCSVN